MTNVAARNQAMRASVLQAFENVCPCVVCMALDEDLNDIVVGMNPCGSDGGSTAGQSSVALKHVSGDNATGGNNCKDRWIDDKTQCRKVDSLREAPLSSLHSQTSSCNGGLLSCFEEDVRRRVCELVTVIGKNGGDVEELESELIRFVTSKTICKQ